MSSKNCPCGRIKQYTYCCGTVHLDINKAITAEDLMRSRFVAFTKGMGNYLMNSHHSSTRPLDQKDAIVSWANSVKWTHLEILSKSSGGKEDHEGTVEFKAHFKEKGKKTFIHENSKFIRENGHWSYLGFAD